MNDILTPKDWKSRTFASEFSARDANLNANYNENLPRNTHSPPLQVVQIYNQSDDDWHHREKFDTNE